MDPDPLDIPTVDPHTSRSLQTYHHCHPTSVVPVPKVILDPKVIADSPSMLPPSLNPILKPQFDLLTALQNVMCQTRNPYPYYIYLCYHRLPLLHLDKIAT